MDNKLKNYLAKNKIRYQLAEHKKVYTAFNEAETQHLKTKEVAKTVLVKADNNYALVVVPAAKYVDFNKVKKALASAKGGSASGGKKVSMAKESDIAKVLKTKVGLIHPFGTLYKLPVLLDNVLAKQKEFSTSAGSYTESVEIKTKDYMKLIQPIIGKFVK
jgi:Ala-tRNA(Pro) deacylase